jgi:hypothetical protein
MVFRAGLVIDLRPDPRKVDQGCQMVYFQTKNSNLGRFWRALEWKLLVSDIPIWNILRPFGIFAWSFGKFAPFWENCVKKNLATLMLTVSS